MLYKNVKLLVLANLTLALCNAIHAASAKSSTWSDLIDRGTQEESEQKFASSIKYFTRAAEVAEKSGTALQIVRSLNRLIVAQIENGEIEKSDASFKRALELVKKAKASHSKDLGEMQVSLSDVANVYKMQMLSSSKPLEQTLLLHKYVKSMLEVRPGMDSEMSNTLTLMASQFIMRGAYQKAAEVNEEQVAMLKKQQPIDREKLYAILGEQANSEAAAGQYARADAAYFERHQLYKTFHTPAATEIDLASYERQVGAVAYLRGAVPEAIKHYSKALEIHTLKASAWKQMLALDFYCLGCCALASNDISSATKFFNSCLKISANQKGESLTGCTALGAEQLADILRKQGKSKDAAALSALSRKIRDENSNWKTSTNPDPKKFFLIWGFLPYRC